MVGCTGAGAAFGAAVAALGAAFLGAAFCFGASTVTGGSGWVGDWACAVWRMATAESTGSTAAAAICRRRLRVGGRTRGGRIEGMEAPQHMHAPGARHYTRADQASAGGPRAGGHTACRCAAGEIARKCQEAGAGSCAATANGSGAPTTYAGLCPEQTGQLFCASEGLGIDGRSASERDALSAPP